MYGEAFYGFHTAQHQLQWSSTEVKLQWSSELAVQNLGIE